MAESEKITRRDFLNGALLASGAALVAAGCPFQMMAAEDWNGYPGLGDYADSNGNTHQVMSDGHMIRDHAFERAPGAISDTGETHDCVVVGGGISGLAAALFYQRGTGGKKSCLVLENHAIFGGEAKRNEFQVDGQRLIASQGSAMWFQPLPGSFLQRFYDSVGIDPQRFIYQQNASSIATGVTPYAGTAATSASSSARVMDIPKACGSPIPGARSWRARRSQPMPGANCWQCSCLIIMRSRGATGTLWPGSSTPSRSKTT